MRMRPFLIFAVGVIISLGNLRAQTNAWQPSPGHKQILLWPGKPPDARLASGPEFATTSTELISGKPVVVAERVSEPTMTVYSPKGSNTGVAVVIFPGGGYQV